VLTKWEGGLIGKYCRCLHAPIFIIGLPRVGSTLVYQTLVRGLAVSYLCNAAASFPQSPALITHWLTRIWGITPPRGFDSAYGVAAGWRAASQGRDIWARWFPEDQSYVGQGELAPSSGGELRGTVAAVEDAFGQPFVNKSQGHAVRILALREVFPNAVFIHVRRDALAVAESILRGRRECFGHDAAWFSVKPSTYPQLAGLAPHKQIAGQIAGVTADIERSLSIIGAEDTFAIDYERFCNAPRAVLDEFACFYEHRTGRRLSHRLDVPASFPRSGRTHVSAADTDLLQCALQDAAQS
jgi:hypothetical protein